MLSLAASGAEQRLQVAPKATDERLSAADAEHLVLYDPRHAQAPLLVWLGGTGGTPLGGPQLFLDSAVQQGHRVVALSYPNTPAVAQVCVGATLRANPGCAGQMRQHRAWGEPQSALVPDRPEEAIVPRLTKLLEHLAREDPAGAWAQYLDGAAPRWDRVVLAGQSQGGGMAAFIAQTQRVAGVIVFSGGWDREPGGDIAAWYARPSATPLQRWHGTFHVQEAQAATLSAVYRRLGLPPEQIHALDLPVRGAQAHGEGIHNPAYKPLWLQMLRLQP